MIEIKNVIKNYDDECIFSNLNFKAELSKFTIIQGKSGTGKTTLLNIISTVDSLYSCDSFFINNKEIKTLTENERARFRAKNIGFIFQSYALIPEFSLIDNVTLPLEMNNVKKSKAILLAKKLLKELIPEIDETLYYKKPSQLSGGQQQRVSIARALIHDPSIIIADEPTANLDAQAAKQVKEYLLNLARNGKCIIVVSHESDYLNYADILYEFTYSASSSCKSILSDAKCLNH